MAMVRTALLVSLFAGFTTSCIKPASAHEFWLEPSDYNLIADEQLTVTLRNGEKFRGDLLPYLPAEFVRFSLRNAGEDYPVESALGDVELTLPRTGAPGLKVLTYESQAQQLEYSSYAKFAQFAREEGVEWVLEEFQNKHDRQLPVREKFRRFAKSLFSVGMASGADQPMGMELELVAMDNPYLIGEKDALRFQLLYQGAPLVGAQVSIFSRSQSQSAHRDTAITDHQGIVTLSQLPGREYLLNAVHLRAPGLLERFTQGTHWESLWASLTFGVSDAI